MNQCSEWYLLSVFEESDEWISLSLRSHASALLFSCACVWLSTSLEDMAAFSSCTSSLQHLLIARKTLARAAAASLAGHAPSAPVKIKSDFKRL